MRRDIPFSVAIHAVAALAAIGALPTATQAETFMVVETADFVDALPGDGECATRTGVCTLRAAVQEANALAGTDEIVLARRSFVLSIPDAGDDGAASGDLDVSDDLIVRGQGPTVTEIASDASRLWDLAGTARLELVDLAMRPGEAPLATVARLEGGTVVLRGCLVVAPPPSLSVRAGRLELLDSFFAGSAWPVLNLQDEGDVLLRNVMVSGPGGTGETPAIDHLGGTLRIESSTLVGDGTVLRSRDEGLVTLNSIVAGGEPTCAVTQPWESLGHDVLGPGCEVLDGAPSVVAVRADDPLVVADAVEGDPLQVRVPYSGGGAVDGGDPSPPGSGGTACPATDALGVERVGRCDAGAIQVTGETDGRLTLDCPEGPFPRQVNALQCTATLTNVGAEPSARALLHVRGEGLHWPDTEHPHFPYEVVGATCEEAGEPTARLDGLTCRTDSLAAGESIVVTLSAEGPEAGPARLVARGGFTARDPEPGDLAATHEVEITDEATTDLVTELEDRLPRGEVLVGERLELRFEHAWIDGFEGPFSRVTHVLPPELGFEGGAGLGCDPYVEPRATCYFNGQPWAPTPSTHLYMRALAPGTVVVETESESFDHRELDPSNNHLLTEVTITAATVDLVAALTASPALGQVAEPLTHSITVANESPWAAYAATLVATFPPSATVAEASPSQGACSLAPGRVECGLGLLESRVTADIALVLLPGETGDLTTEVVAAHGGAEDNPGDESASVTTPIEGGGAFPPNGVGPTLLLTKPSDTEARLEWGPAAVDATHDAPDDYLVWAAPRACGPFSLAATVPAPTLEWTDGDSMPLRLYKIGAANAGGVSDTPLPGGADCP